MTPDLKSRIGYELDKAGVLNEKAARFFSYIFCRILPELEIEGAVLESIVISKYIRLLPQMNFPFYKSNRKLLILPCDIILNEVLYTDRDLSMFFIRYARFCLLLKILSEIYPAWFHMLSHPPYRVPAPFKGSVKEHSSEMLKEHVKQNSHSLSGEKNEKMKPIEDKRLQNILVQLSGCHYLPYGTDFTPHNKAIFDAVRGNST